MELDIYTKTLSLVKHRIASNKNILGLEEKEGVIIERTKFGTNLWIPVKKIEDYKNFLNLNGDKIFISLNYYFGIEEEILKMLKNEKLDKLNIAIFIDKEVRLISLYLLSKYENPKKALNAIILQNGT